jgi:hypothetical protein
MTSSETSESKVQKRGVDIAAEPVRIHAKGPRRDAEIFERERIEPEHPGPWVLKGVKLGLSPKADRGAQKFSRRIAEASTGL